MGMSATTFRFFVSILFSLLLVGAVQAANGAEPTDANLAAFEKAFQDALASGDFETVANSFASDARVFEGGSFEGNVKDYLEHHLKPEMPMIQKLNREVISQAFHREGGTAWFSTEARIWGKIEKRDIDLSQAETLNLIFDNSQWKISHVHWSSRPNKKDKK